MFNNRHSIYKHHRTGLLVLQKVKMSRLIVLTWLISFHLLPYTALATDSRLGIERAVANAQFWRSSGDEFIQNNPHLGFRWISGSTRSTLRCMNPKVGFMGMDVQEIQIKYEDNLPNEVMISVYNRGDSGELSQDRFKELINVSRNRITDMTSTRPGRVENQRRTRDAKVYRQIWNRNPLLVILSWSETEEHRNNGQTIPHRSEYVRVKMTLADYFVDMWDHLDRKTKVNQVNPSKNVKRTDFGDVYIVGVPMVDQGDKGYCAVACMERLFRYYGVPVDQHEVAQIADSSAALGTSPEVMMDALKRMGTKFRVRVKEHFTIDYRELKSMVTEYNKLADDHDKPEIKLEGTVYLNTLFGSMDPELLKSARVDDRNGFRSFQRDIQKYVGEGVPLLWSVLVGLFPEEPPIRGMGGHMRLIIGYNEKTGEILYSDTWGNGHELKRLPIDQAWTMTFGIFTAESRDAR